MNEKLLKALQRHFAENKKDYWPKPRPEAVTATEFHFDIESDQSGCCCDSHVETKVNITVSLANADGKHVQTVWFESEDLEGLIEHLFELID